ncbi:unnamed protein product [Protopolystoma xenopodis]|uniref:Uncharacterized protein n=1 Tax=Protopolystoma xenopodis TaxID=117903 RepID=A0A3S5ARS2_9PLAT|nr:unnamed protein product [Protopolystoma xenopodis]
MSSQESEEREMARPGDLATLVNGLLESIASVDSEAPKLAVSSTYAELVNGVNEPSEVTKKGQTVAISVGKQVADGVNKPPAIDTLDHPQPHQQQLMSTEMSSASGLTSVSAPLGGKTREFMEAKQLVDQMTDQKKSEYTRIHAHSTWCESL